MSYQERVSALRDDPETLEQTYQAALQEGQADAFRQAIDQSYAETPDNLLYAAWFHRLKHVAAQAKGYVVAWAWAIPLAVINGLLFWWLSADRYTVIIQRFDGLGRNVMPGIVLMAGAIAAVFVLAYLTVVGRRRWLLSAVVGIVLLGATAYVFLTYHQAGSMPFQQQVVNLTAMHLPLLAWSGLGVVLLARHRDSTNRFAFLMKSLEAVVLAGLFVIAGGLLTAITFGLFEALDVGIPDLVQRLFIAGGAGLVVVLAIAIVYDPRVAPAEQERDQGLSRLLSLLTRVMLPLALLVLLAYLGFIPFNFRAPFDNRNVLVVYNGMLFAVVALLAAVTPLTAADISPRLARWLRRGIIAVAALALLVGIYALAAISYRTAIDHLTPNRLTFIGWNVINIGLLGQLLGLQVRAGEGRWAQSVHRAYGIGSLVYVVWTVVVIVAMPWLFGIDQGNIADLPMEIQRIIYENPEPILLKCTGSPHIYALEKGEKRWIDSIDTLTDRGYSWDDVLVIACDNLRQVPDGTPIPPDAGPAPQP